MAFGNRGCSCCYPAGRGWYLVLVLSYNPFWLWSCLVWSCLWVWPHWSGANAAHPLCSRLGQCSAVWLLPGVLSSSPAPAENQLPPGFRMGPPYPLLRLTPPSPTRKLVVSLFSDPFHFLLPYPWNHGIVGVLSQAPSVPRSDLLPFILLWSHPVLSVGIPIVAAPLISWRKWKKSTFFSQNL